MLYLILPYFDFTKSIFFEKNLDLFINNYAKEKNLRIVLIEGIYDKSLPDFSSKVYKHLKFKLKNILWVKENLINIAIKNLPTDAQYIAWADRDILLTNPDWIQETIDKLKIYDIVQPFSEVLHLNKNYEAEMVVRSNNLFTFTGKGIISNTITKQKIRGAFCGQIWAINKNFYDKIGKLNDIEIVGGADAIIAKACVLQDYSYISDKIKNKSKEKVIENWSQYYLKFKDCKYSYVTGLLVHYWHTTFSQRAHESRYKILLDENYNPEKDITYDENGVICFTKVGQRLEEKIHKYFINKDENKINEDSTNKICSNSYMIKNVLIPVSEK